MTLNKRHYAPGSKTQRISLTGRCRKDTQALYSQALSLTIPQTQIKVCELVKCTCITQVIILSTCDKELQLCVKQRQKIILIMANILFCVFLKTWFLGWGVFPDLNFKVMVFIYLFFFPFCHNSRLLRVCGGQSS